LSTFRLSGGISRSGHLSHLPPFVTSGNLEAVASSSKLFEKLVTTWRFEPVPQSPTVDDKTLVTLDLAFAFADPLYAAISAAFFGEVSKLMVQAFEGRCAKVYDTRHR